MFKYLAFCALIGFAVALSPAALGLITHSHGSSSEDAHAEVKSFHSDVRHDGFDYSLDTSNHIHAAQSGDEHGNIHGDYEYVSPEGVHVKVTYVADENGYQPSSDLLPVAPPIPAAILKSIAYNEAHPPPKEEHGHN